MSGDLEENSLWLILVEVVHAMPMFPFHRAHVRDFILPESPSISAEDVASRLDIPLGEAVVILHELQKEKPSRVGTG